MEPEFADELEVRPDSSCWWLCNLLSLRRLITSTKLRIKSAAMARVRVPISANIDCALNWMAPAVKLWMKSRMAELWAPKSEDMVDEIAGVELVCWM